VADAGHRVAEVVRARIAVLAVLRDAGAGAKAARVFNRARLLVVARSGVPVRPALAVGGVAVIVGARIAVVTHRRHADALHRRNVARIPGGARVAVVARSRDRVEGAHAVPFVARTGGARVAVIAGIRNPDAQPLGIGIDVADANFAKMRRVAFGIEPAGAVLAPELVLVDASDADHAAIDRALIEVAAVAVRAGFADARVAVIVDRTFVAVFTRRRIVPLAAGTVD